MYDGDTVYITMPGLPAELARMSVRFDGVDTPERGSRAQCEAEAELAERARDFVVQAIENAERVEFCEPLWGKYAGCVVARVVVDGEDLCEELIIADLARGPMTMARARDGAGPDVGYWSGAASGMVSVWQCRPRGSSITTRPKRQ